jgi:class 3 adenylate cyclase
MADNPLITDASQTPPMPRASEVRDRIRAVLFAQITDTAALYESLGDVRALSVITRALVAMEQQVYEHRGEVIKTVGEEILAVFPDASAAATSAIAMQQRMEHFVREAGIGARLRVGMHSGPIIEEQGDVFGDAVNVAARLVRLGNADQIITDGETLKAMRAALRRRARAIDRRRVKGKRGEIDIVEIGWRRRGGAPFTTEQGMLIDRGGSAHMMALKFGGREIMVDGARASFTIGRDESNDLPVASTKASRQHARIERRRDKFVLFDHSTNGTYVTLEGEPEVLVKHESLLLHGRGVLSIGEAAGARGSKLIEFECR